MAKKTKPNFKKKEPNSKNNNREEFAGDQDLNQTKRKTHNKITNKIDNATIL